MFVPLFGAAYAAPNKGTTILYWFRSLSTLLSPTENSKISRTFQGLRVIFKDFSKQIKFSMTFQEKALYIQMLFKPARTPVYNWLLIAC